MSDPRHPGYIIGDHWLETAYSRICAGENETETLADYGYVPAAQITRLRAELQQAQDRLRLAESAAEAMAYYAACEITEMDTGAKGWICLVCDCDDPVKQHEKDCPVGEWRAGR